MESFSCLECKKETQTVLDHRTGDTICTDCGLVLESHYIDETPEWRCFAEDQTANDNTRVGSPTNPFLTQPNPITLIPPAGSSSDNFGLKLQNLAFPDPDRAVIKGFNNISSMADRLGLRSGIILRAEEIFKEVEERKYGRGRPINSICAACLFIACREMRLPRTLKEIASAAGVSMKQINKAYLIVKRHNESIDYKAGSTVELGKRICSILGMSKQEARAVREAVEKSEGFNVRRNPKSVLAAIIYMVTQLSDATKQKPLKDVSMAAEVAELTIKRSYKDVYPYATRIIPNWFANEEDIKALSRP